MTPGERVQPLRTGVIGVGSLGFHHAWKYVANPRAHLIGVVDRDPERAQTVARETGSLAFSRATDLIAAVDAVSIATPAEDHRKLAEACLDQGVHVLLEKPIATTLEEADALLQVAHQGDQVLQVGYLERFHPALCKLRAQGWDREPPLYIESSRLNTFQPRSLDIDVVLDLMSHDIDLILDWVQAPVTEIRAIGVPVVTDKVDMANARLAFANGTVANISASRVARKRLRELRLFQSQRYLSLDLLNSTLALCERNSQAMGDGAMGTVQSAHYQLEQRDLLAHEIEDFVGACLGEPATGASGGAARGVLAVALQIRTAIDTFRGAIK